MIAGAVYSFLFYTCAGIAVLLALRAVATPLILRAAVYLMGVLGITAGFYLLLKMEFLAGVQVLVYVGGIVVLFVFAMMLTHSSALSERKPPFSRRALGALIAIAFFWISSSLFLKTEFLMLKEGTLPVNDTKALGLLLLDSGARGYVLPFEVISLLLLSVLVGGIVIARKGRSDG